MRHAFLAAALFVLAVPSESAAADNITLTVSASLDAAYSATIEALDDMEFEVKVSDKSAGHISAEHKSPFGEANHFMDITMKKASDQQTDIKVAARKRRFAISGGPPEKRLKEFRDALHKALGEGIAITEKK